MHFVILSSLSAFALFLAPLAMLVVGRRIGAHRLQVDPAGASAGHAAVETAVFDCSACCWPSPSPAPCNASTIGAS